MRKEMPRIDLDRANLSPWERRIAEGIVNSRTGRLRASKPPVKHTDLGLDPEDPNGFRHLYQTDGGETAYVWRMVAFAVSPRSQHQCLPVMAQYDLPGRVDEARDLARDLDRIADKVVDTVDVREWHGIARWSRALGYG